MALLCLNYDLNVVLFWVLLWGTASNVFSLLTFFYSSTDFLPKCKVELVFGWFIKLFTIMSSSFFINSLTLLFSLYRSYFVTVLDCARSRSGDPEGISSLISSSFGKSSFISGFSGHFSSCSSKTESLCTFSIISGSDTIFNYYFRLFSSERSIVISISLLLSSFWAWKWCVYML